MSRKPAYKNATLKQVFDWLMAGDFRVDSTDIYSANDIKLSQRLKARKNSDVCDLRVDFYKDGFRRTINVSCVVWMYFTRTIIPDGFEIHHRDENTMNNLFGNLVCVHKMDHPKLHEQVSCNVEEDEDEEIPF